MNSNTGISALYPPIIIELLKPVEQYIQTGVKNENDARLNGRNLGCDAGKTQQS